MTDTRKKLLLRLSGAALAATMGFSAAPNSAQASTLLNAGFETGTLPWISSGTTGTTSSLGGFLPVAGDFFGFVASGGLGEEVYSTLTQTFTALKDEIITGYVAFDTGDLFPFNDDGYLSVFANGFSEDLFVSDVATVGDSGDSGWKTYSFTAPFSGTFTIEAGVRNVGDDREASWVYLDAGTANAVIPEPAVWGMLLVGFGLVGAGARARKRQLVLA